MKTKTKITTLASLLLLSSCGGSGKSLYINEYESFNEFNSHLSVLDNAWDEGEVFAFDSNFDGIVSKEYKVIGVDYEHRAHKEKHGRICDTLYYRESFVVISVSSFSELFIVSFGYAVENLDFNDLEWVQRRDTKYNYSPRYLGEEIQYVLTDSQNTLNLLYVKFQKGINEASIISVLDNVKMNYKEANYI